jgi:hypothetical protein
MTAASIKTTPPNNAKWERKQHFHFRVAIKKVAQPFLAVPAPLHATTIV